MPDPAARPVDPDPPPLSDKPRWTLTDEDVQQAFLAASLKGGHDENPLVALLAVEVLYHREVDRRRAAEPAREGAVAAEEVAEAFHDAYETAAKGHGWNTQEGTSVPFADLPEANRQTMLDATRAVLARYPFAREGVVRWKGQDWRVVVQYAFSPPEVVRNADGIVATLRPLSGDPDGE